MTSMDRKPTLLFVQYKYDSKLPGFLLNHKFDHVRCLQEFFEVVVIDEDCNYVEVCDKYEPQVALFESGLDNLTCRKPRITGIHGCPGVPKLGLHNADAFSGARAGFLSDMDHWGIETLFAISSVAAEHMPDVAGRLFTWPNFIDTATYRDYGVYKSIPVLLTGNTQAFYPWRHDVFRLAREHFPALTTPHPGYAPGAVKVRFLHGESYARMINASHIVPACGTVAKDVVRKHLEIPACRACLVTEESPALKAAGFVDMVNCVFADRQTIVDKLSHLFATPEVLSGITDAGYELVQATHTMRNRAQIYQWVSLHSSLRPGERIVQSSPFGDLMVEQRKSASATLPPAVAGAHLKALYEGHAKRSEHRYEEAAELYLKCLRYMQWLPEARLGLALCELHLGRPKKAREWLEPSLTYILEEYKAEDPDPVEWAYYIISFLCSGKLQKAISLTQCFETLRSPVLDRTRWAVAVLANAPGKRPSGPNGETVGRSTLHPTIGSSFDEWWDDLIPALTKCGQDAMVRVLEEARHSDIDDFENRAPHVASTRILHSEARDLESSLDGQGNRKGSRKREADLFRGKIARRRFKAAIRRQIVSRLHRWETTYGSFLPYRMSAVRDEEFCSAVHNLARQEEIRTALVIGARHGSLATEAFLSGAIENACRPVVLCVGKPRRQPLFQRGSNAFHPAVKWYDLAVKGNDSAVQSFEGALQKATEENVVDSLDALVLERATGQCEIDIRALIGKWEGKIKQIVLSDIRSHMGYQNYEYLLGVEEYYPASVNTENDHEYAIFRLHQSVCIETENFAGA